MTVKKLLLNTNKSCQELSDKYNIKYQTMYCYLTGRREPRNELYFRLLIDGGYIKKASGLTNG